ncbi:chromosome segregation protein SMC, primarily archaeal type [Rubidibacter lacunae KORDI 51-2]|uniref:Chromosome partition protein Smc n=1 Tax=Rubidibacter lacunae KORDI 51-2 TaxID=582515 RepID=U5DJU4_9CHRO|nr:chromosome segregation protein SMC [Rubidibacter lacunae]ERN41172.1 chromosome segregation protein SMC, primarily archaeal type [Rubidibacter lacunae KORDI 51-2]
MVHIKRLELSHFKSFGSTTQIPFLPGFTVVSGPNGSGKSNILDALLFALGLASSRGMRAERLPDLINHDRSGKGRRTQETTVTVWFDLSDAEDLEGVEVVEIDPDPNRNDGHLVASNTGHANGNGNSNNHRHTNEGSDSNGHTHENGHSSNREALANNSHPNNGHANNEDAGARAHGLAGGNGDRPEIEWSVTRRLRVTKEGNYASTYSINGRTCTQAELHEQMQRLRIYPEGYNVVLQGDVTRIITMSSRERRTIIDELAGVAEYDRKIERAKETLEAVRDREERCHIIEQELARARDRAAAESRKAEQYRQLKQQIEHQQQWELVLAWQALQQQETQLHQKIAAGEAQAERLAEKIRDATGEIQAATETLERLNARVKALGEDEQLAIASELAKREASLEQLQARASELVAAKHANAAAADRTRTEIAQNEQAIERLGHERAALERTRLALSGERERAAAALAESKARADELASASETWMQQHAALSREAAALQAELEPLRAERARLQERATQLQGKLTEQDEQLTTLVPELGDKQAEIARLEAAAADTEQEIGDCAERLAAAERERRLQQDTQARLQREQRDKQRQLDKLEAALQTQREMQGTYATQAILQADIPGVCGLVAQLGEVAPRFQVALETAAGGRLACIVVEDDGVAAAGIEILKRERAGRATFLPLNKIHQPRFSAVRAIESATGFVDYAVNLVDCDSRFDAIFSYVFGSTAVFETLTSARSHLGRTRIVTLDGELLEASGAMSGGSRSMRSTGLHFGKTSAQESREIADLKRRLEEIDRVYSASVVRLQQAEALCQQLAHALGSARQIRQEQVWQLQQLRQDCDRLDAQQQQLVPQRDRSRAERTDVTARLEAIAATLPPQEADLERRNRELTALERAHSHTEWQTLQGQIRAGEARLQEREQALYSADQQIQARHTATEHQQEKLQEARDRLTNQQQQQQHLQQQQVTLQHQQSELQEQIAQTQADLKRLSQELWTAKQERDRAEAALATVQQRERQLTWEREKCLETLDAHRAARVGLGEQLQARAAELPDPLPEVPPIADAAGTAIATENVPARLAALQEQIRSNQKHLQAMEPVNMLAIEDFERTQARLDELSGKLATLEAERTELLLRIETFTTRRQHAFQEAFDAVNANFQTIFAALSDGDGYLQIEESEDSSRAGLTLVAHPKGKPVRRLHSMSGGEKSLTALSFIFALQRYRPSPFYAFDEVDMFLDGANVERLAKMMRHQAQQAQFIVVSLRRPTIESANRTIGVTQARGAHTQVLGLKL